MKTENMVFLESIIRRKSTKLGFRQLRQSSRIIPMVAPRKQSHLMLKLSSSVVPPLPLQMSIQDEEDTVRALLFPSPCILTEQTAKCVLALANEANRDLYRGAALGRFWVDIENLDFAYEVFLKEQLFEACAEDAAMQLFDVPLAHFTDLHIPLIMLSGGAWDSATALRYFRQLRKEGYVDNSEYGLW